MTLSLSEGNAEPPEPIIRAQRSRPRAPITMETLCYVRRSGIADLKDNDRLTSM